MKRILITGENSYVGTSFKNYINESYPNQYDIQELNVVGDSWKSYDFSQHDIIYHVAGIAHIKETKDNQDLYYKVNRDLVIEIADKAKEEGIQQFIFLSTMSVYGIEQGEINLDTPTNPKNAYGKSKLQAEEYLNSIKSKQFIVSILRPPMVYGPGCKGNYPRLAKLARKTPIFPDFPNKRSMIFIDNLSEFIKELIDNKQEGLFLPQNSEFVNTSDMVKKIANLNGKRLYLPKFFNPIIRLFMFVPTVHKVFGSLYYSEYTKYYEQKVTVKIKDSIILSENLNG